MEIDNILGEFDPLFEFIMFIVTTLRWDKQYLGLLKWISFMCDCHVQYISQSVLVLERWNEKKLMTRGYDAATKYRKYDYDMNETM